MDGLVIRPEQARDHAAITRVVEAAFGSREVPDLVVAIRRSAEYVGDLALVAELDGQIVGHVMVSGATLVLEGSGDDRTIMMLSPLAVDPERHGDGIGSALVREVVRLTDERGEPFVVLEGSSGYYGRLGFEPASNHGLVVPLPSWASAESAQVLPLAHDDPSLRGCVVYPTAFDSLSED